MRREVARERAQVEHLMDAVRARDDFLSVASHELKTPLTSFQLQLGAIERSLTAFPQPEIGERLDMARRSVRRLAGLIETLLDVSQLTTGRMQLSLAQVDLAELARGVVLAHQEDARRQGCAVRLQIEPVVEGRFDRGRMEQVLHHLLSNALKFGEGQPVDLSLREEEGRVKLSVVDHGIGIPAADRQRVFERFERAVPVRKIGRAHV